MLFTELLDTKDCCSIDLVVSYRLSHSVIASRNLKQYFEASIKLVFTENSIEIQRQQFTEKFMLLTP